ncbi:hypothetical protein ACF3NT_13630 [Naumannella halotolerans]|uniref:hypothetical protein n=1 Tax=Naumannella halotolerans TaxID=993414 RepID=UPI00370D4CE4
MSQIRLLTRTVGRREALRCLGLGVVGAVSVAVLSACGEDPNSPSGGSSVAAQTLSAFLQGSWAISFPLAIEREPFTVEVKDGTWSAAYRDGERGTWKYAGGSLQIVNWTGDDSVGTATGVPEQVTDGGVPATLPWTWKGNAESTADELSISLNWKSKSKTMTITGTDANGEPLVIEAKRS